MKIFLIEDFFHLPPALMVKSGAWGKLIYVEKPEVKNLVTPSL
jgi:hypothetical protein